MASRAAITVHRPPEEVRRMWHSGEYPHEYVDGIDAAVTFRDAPGDRGAEIHVQPERSTQHGKLAKVAQKLRGSVSLAKVKDDLRRFKQLVESGEVARSEGVPEGERAERKLKQRPAQPLEQGELEKAGVV
jgi:hypothetical protein